MRSQKNRKRKFTAIFYKELVLATLAVLSVFFVFYEILWQPSDEVKVFINRFELLVVIVFLTDFFTMLAHARNKSEYMKNNWYMLLASIPILDSWAEILRGLRLFELVRLVRAGEHLRYAVQESRAQTGYGRTKKRYNRKGIWQKQ